jgi:hypothetical protein
VIHNARLCIPLQKTITIVDKLLEYKVEAKGVPSICEDDSLREKWFAKNKKKEKGKVKLSRKFGEDKAKQLDAPKKKGMLISYWICEKDHHVKNCPMKYNLSTMEKVDKAYMIGLLQVLCVVLEDKCTIIQEKYFTGIFYVPAVFNGISIDTMVDTGVNHNSMKEDVLRELGLQLEFTWTSLK